MRPTAAQMAASLGLQPHPEGGFYLETYRAAKTLQTPRGERAATTAILFLVTADSVSRLHRLLCDELWVYQGGVPLELVTIAPDGSVTRRVLGDLTEEVTLEAEGAAARPEGSGGAEPPSGAEPEGSAPMPQAMVPAGSWQGARLAGGPHLPADRAWALVSCVCTPGFDFADFELGDRDALVAGHPDYAELIRELT